MKKQTDYALRVLLMAAALATATKAADGGVLGELDSSHAPYYYAWEHGWLYTLGDPSGDEVFWWWSYRYDLGWMYSGAPIGDWHYASAVDDWVTLGGAWAPSWWALDGQWQLTPARREWFVATDGSDTAEGSAAQPLASITKALSMAEANDVITVRGGTYREQLLPTVSGAPHFPITLRADPQSTAPVVVSAWVALLAGSDGLGEWEAHENNIYSIRLPASFGSVANRVLVRLDGQRGVDARWPNADDSFDFFRGDRASAADVFVVEQNGLNKRVHYYHDGLNGFAENAWQNARLFYVPGKGWADGSVNVSASGAGYVEFSYTEVTFGGNWNEAAEGDVFYLMGRKVAIDQPGEFFHDVAGRDGPNGTLYIQFPAGKTPANTVVEAKRQTFGFRASSRQHWVVRDLVFDGGAVAALSTTEDIHFDGITVEGVYAMGQTTYDAAVALDGVNVSLRNSRIYQSTTAGVSVGSTGAVVENNVIGWTAGSAIQRNGGARDLLIRNNTVFMSGNQNIAITAPGSRFLSNRAYMAGMIITDIAAFNAWGSGDMDGMEVAYNVVHDNVAVEDRNRYKPWNGGMGIRFDSGGGAGVSNGSVHHNVVYNNTWDDINIWGLEAAQANVGNAQIDVFNNTVDGVLAVAGANVNAAGITVARNASGQYLPRFNASNTGVTLADNFVETPDSYGNESGDPLYFNAEAADFRPVGASPLLGEPAKGAFADGGPFPVAGAIWRTPVVADLQARFIETRNGMVAIGVAGMPHYLHLPDGTRLRVNGVVSDNLWHRYDINTHSAEAVFILEYTDAVDDAPVEIEIGGTGGGFMPLNAVSIGGGISVEQFALTASTDWSGRVNTANADAGGILGNLRKTDPSNLNLQVGDNATNAEQALVLSFDLSAALASGGDLSQLALVVESKGINVNAFPGAIDVLVGAAIAQPTASADLYTVANGGGLRVAATLPAGFDTRAVHELDLSDPATLAQLALSPQQPWVVILLRAADPAAASFSNGIIEQTFFNIPEARLDVGIQHQP